MQTFKCQKEAGLQLSSPLMITLLKMPLLLFVALEGTEMLNKIALFLVFYWDLLLGASLVLGETFI